MPVPSELESGRGLELVPVGAGGSGASSRCPGVPVGREVWGVGVFRCLNPSVGAGVGGALEVPKQR